MTITIDNLTINNNATAGTVIGVLTGRDDAGNVMPCNYRLTKGASGFFAISDNELVTEWSTPIATGYYSVRVHAIGTTARFGDSVAFTVTVQMPTPAASIQVNGAANPVVAEGATLAIAVDNGPGTQKDWVGLSAAGAPDTSYITWVYLSGSHTAPNVSMTSAIVMMTAPTVDASYEARFYLNDGFTVLARTTFRVRGAALSSPQPPRSGAR
jgi:hypothetical protein